MVACIAENLLKAGSALVLDIPGNCLENTEKIWRLTSRFALSKRELDKNIYGMELKLSYLAHAKLCPPIVF